MSEAETQAAKEVVEVLVASHRESLEFVERRVGDRALAEEIVQDALVRSLDHPGDELLLPLREPLDTVRLGIASV